MHEEESAKQFVMRLLKRDSPSYYKRVTWITASIIQLANKMEEKEMGGRVTRMESWEMRAKF